MELDFVSIPIWLWLECIRLFENEFELEPDTQPKSFVPHRKSVEAGISTIYNITVDYAEI